MTSSKKCRANYVLFRLALGYSAARKDDNDDEIQLYFPIAKPAQ